MTKRISAGDTVNWKYGKGKAAGKVQSCKAKQSTIKSKGTQITRNGNAENPACIIVQKDKTKVLKLQSELSKTTR